MKLLPQHLLLQQLSRWAVPVFLFHKVPNEDDTLVPHELARQRFETTLDFIEEHFRVIPLAETVKALQAGRIIPHTASLTFDDGYAEWSQILVPLLERRNLPATFFITTGQFTGTPMWHERVTHAFRKLQSESLFISGFGLPEMPVATLEQRIHARNQYEKFLKYLSLEDREELMCRLEQHAGIDKAEVQVMPEADIRSIHAKGFEIGAHTHFHPILSLTSELEAKREIGDARDWLSGVIGRPVNGFAYPNGKPGTDFLPSHVDLVKQCGYQYAVTTGWGRVGPKTSRFEIPRFTPWGPSSAAMCYQLARNLVTPARASATHAGNPPKPKRILYVENGAGFGGAVIALRTLLKGMTTQQVEAHVVCNLPVEDFTRLAVVKSQHLVRDVLFNARSLSAAVTKSGLGPLKRPIHFIIGRLDDLLNRLPYLLKLMWQIVRIRPDIVHGNNEPSSNREAMLAARIMRVPYVQHLRGAIAQSQHTPWILKLPDLFIPVSRWLAGELLSAGVDNQRIRHIYDAVELPAEKVDAQQARAKLKQEFGINETAKIVAMIGMLVEWKGQHHFIEAVQQIADQHLDAVFMLIGGSPEKSDGRYEAQIRGQCEAADLGPRLIMTGKRNDLSSLMPGFDIVVSASTEPEPLGLVMLEALFSGCRFIGPRFGAATEIVTSPEIGLLYEPRSVGSLRDCLDHMLSDGALSRIEAQTWREFSSQVHATVVNSAYSTL